MGRLLGRLLLLVGLLAGVGLLASRAATPAHAATTTITSCTEAALDTAITNAASGDTLTFGCSGDILLTTTLTISKNLTLDGSGETVTLDGQNQVEVLSVNSGVTFTLKALTIAHGSAFDGGGLFNDHGTVSISDSTVANNSAGGGGAGALDNKGGTVTITNSTFSGNSTPATGGAIYNTGTLSITNSTFANNSSTQSSAGAIFNDDTLSISNSTFANNSAADGGGLENGLENASISIGGSIVANNTGGNCSSFGGGVSDQGYNLESGTDCGFTGTGSLQNTDPLLDPSGLQNNGGPTQTIALQQGSPAIDQIPSASCPATDQRGVSRPDNGEMTCDMGAYEFTDPVDHDLGLSGLPATITVDATSPQGAVVTYTPPTATDESGDNPGPSVSCSPTSGSTFAIGTTKVTCTVSDSDDTNSPVSASFQVVVKDVTAPTLSLPGTITVNATSPSGAVATYTVTATDPDNASSQLTISCTPASGSTLAIGTTTVNCTASDPAGNSTSGSFQVVVNGAATQINNLITTVNSFHLSKSLQTSLDNKLQDVLTAVNAGQTATACSDLTDFISHVQSQSGKGLTVSQANQLIKAAKQIQAVLGC